MVDARKLKVGDMVYNGSFKAVVFDATSNTVQLAWTHTSGVDVLSRTSFFWLFLDKQED